MDSSCPTDSEVWTSFKKGEEWAVSSVYSEYSKKLYWYGLKMTTDVILVEDVIQDLFADLIKNRKQLGTTDNILFYLLKSFKRKLWRKLQKENRLDLRDNPEAYYFEVTWSVEQEIILKETSDKKHELLLEALKQLTPRQKEAIYLRFSKELDYDMIAEIMDISVEGCRNLISKAIRMLKKRIFEGGPDHFVYLLMRLNFHS